MAASQPSPRTLQAPPDVPAMAGVPNGLIDYLRNFALWCRHGFADKVSATVAQPFSLMMATGPDAAAAETPNVYRLAVSQAGVASLTQVPFAGKPSGSSIALINAGPLTAPSVTFAPLPIDAADDAAAARLGVPVGGVYKSGSALMVRTA